MDCRILANPATKGIHSIGIHSITSPGDESVVAACCTLGIEVASKERHTGTETASPATQYLCRRQTPPRRTRFRSPATALVTGGTQGVGAAIAAGIAQAGADVLVHGLHEDELAKSTLDKCRLAGVRAELLTADLAGRPDEYLEDFWREARRLMPGIDLLVNNAGTFIDVPYFEMDFRRYLKTMHLNVTSGYFLTQAFARQWVADGIAGRVVFTGSINGLLSEPTHTAYDTSKGAVAAMVRSLCVTLAPHNIRVNSMAPGLVRTPLTGVLDEDPQLDSWMRLHTPSGKVPGAGGLRRGRRFLALRRGRTRSRANPAGRRRHECLAATRCAARLESMSRKPPAGNPQPWADIASSLDTMATRRKIARCISQRSQAPSRPATVMPLQGFQ